MSAIKDTSADTLRAAARAWRSHHRVGWLFPAGISVTIHDRIDDLIDEIERLRCELANRPTEPVSAGKAAP